MTPGPKLQFFGLQLTQAETQYQSNSIKTHLAKIISRLFGSVIFVKRNSIVGLSLLSLL